MSHHSTGTFEVTVKPAALADTNAGAGLGRMTLEKQFAGDLAATGKGEMLTAGSPDGSGAYVAIEQVIGTLDGRKGSFVFQHAGTMDHGAMTLNITVVPGSGTAELTGISGTFKIVMADGKHSYEFDYTLPK